MNEVNKRWIEIVKLARKAGHLIITHPAGGYFIPDWSNENDRVITNLFVWMMKEQAISRLRLVKRIEESIEQLAQTEIEGL